MMFKLFPDATVSNRTLIAVRWLLCMAIAGTLLAFGVKTLRGDGTSLNAFLFLDWEWPNERAARVENAALWSVLALTAMGVLRPYWWLLMPAGLYLLLEAVLSVQVGGKPFSELAPASAALRFGTPLLTPLLLTGYFRHLSIQNGDTAGQAPDASGDRPWWQEGAFRSGVMLLRQATGVVFLAHGYEAWQHHPGFIDLIIGTGARQLDVWFDESLVKRILSVIGAVDIVVGLGLLVSWSRFLLAWAAIWGLITALSRMTAFGWGAYPDVLLRSTHFMAPLALLLLVWNRAGSNPTSQRA